MKLSPTQRSLITRVINTAESGKPEGNYAALVIYADGPHGIRQITYGCAQTTEYGNLRELVMMYVDASGQYSEQLKPYIDKIGATALIDDDNFKTLLRNAGRNDPVMRKIQDEFFEIRYFKPAMAWADKNGFVEALSALIIYDSFIHSGSILWIIRSTFPTSPPAKGGNEREWVTQYTEARRDWLLHHPKAIVQKSAYRTKAYIEQIKKNNWDLSIVPINMNGTNVSL